MLRTILTVFGVAELLKPGALIETAEKLALENPDECEVRPWVISGARAEGAFFLLLVRRSSGSFSSFKKFLGVIGVLAFLFPRKYLEFGSKLAYTDAEACQWKPWVYHGTRLVGLYYVLVSMNELRKRTPERTEDAEPNRRSVRKLVP